MFDYRVKITLTKKAEAKVKAIATIIIDEMIELHNIRVINSNNGLFVGFPQNKGKDAEGNDKWYDEIWFIGERGKEFKDQLTQKIMDAYYRWKDQN